jgi:hypothetical protein
MEGTFVFEDIWMIFFCHDCYTTTIMPYRAVPDAQQMANELEDCPFCPNQGWYPGHDYNGNVIQISCEFCWTNPLSKFNAHNTTRGESSGKNSESCS